MVQDAFEAALQQWPREGVPDTPRAWVLRTARNKAIDRIRRSSSFETKRKELEAIAERQAAALEAQNALNAAILAQTPRESSGVPDWFYAGVLVVGAGAVLAYAFRDEADIVTVTQTQWGGPETEGSTSTTTETTERTRRSFPWCWPPGLCKRRWHPEEEE